MREGTGESRRGASRLLRFGLGLVALFTIVAVAGNAAEFDTSGIRSSGGPRNILPIESGLDIDDGGPAVVEERVEIPEPILIGLAVVSAVGLVYLLSKQKLSSLFRRPSVRFRRAAAVNVSDDDEDAGAIAEIARDLIDELNEGDSPRHAIQRAYAAVETGFGSDEFARRPAETPLRYLDRIFGRHEAVREPLADLTDLFQRARFSSDPVGESMRHDAIAALTAIRDYYTTTSWRRIAERRPSRATRPTGRRTKAPA